MARAQLETILKGHNLSKKSIDLAWERTLIVKKVINEKKYNITFAEVNHKPEIASPEYKEADREAVMLMESEKISNMNTLEEYKNSMLEKACNNNT